MERTIDVGLKGRDLNVVRLGVVCVFSFQNCMNFLAVLSSPNIWIVFPTSSTKCTVRVTNVAFAKYWNDSNRIANILNLELSPPNWRLIALSCLPIQVFPSGEAPKSKEQQGHQHVLFTHTHTHTHTRTHTHTHTHAHTHTDGEQRNVSWRQNACNQEYNRDNVW